MHYLKNHHANVHSDLVKRNLHALQISQKFWLILKVLPSADVLLNWFNDSGDRVCMQPLQLRKLLNWNLSMAFIFFYMCKSSEHGNYLIFKCGIFVVETWLCPFHFKLHYLSRTKPITQNAILNGWIMDWRKVVAPWRMLDKFVSLFFKLDTTLSRKVTYCTPINSHTFE